MEGVHPADPIHRPYHAVENAELSEQEGASFDELPVRTGDGADLQDPFNAAAISRRRMFNLHAAATRGDRDLLASLGEFQADELNLEDSQGLTALQHAVIHGHKDMVRTLVSRGASPFSLNKRSKFAVSYCKDKSMFEALFCSSASSFSGFETTDAAQHADAAKRTVLHYAAQYATDPRVIAKFMHEIHENNIYAVDECGDSFLHVAAKHGTMSVLEALSESHLEMARLFHCSDDHEQMRSPGMYALLHDQRDFFQALVSRGYVQITLSSIIRVLMVDLIDDPTIQDRLPLFCKTLPTYLALYGNKHYMFDFLLETMLSLGQWDEEYYRTCLHWAIVDKRTDIVQKIITNTKLWQQWPGMQDKDGKTAQQLAFEQKNQMVMELLSAQPSFKQHEERLNKDREMYVQALNAILVGAALIASVTFAGWLQVPFDSEFRSSAMRIYWATNSMSFFTAVATMCVTKIGLIPAPIEYVGVTVQHLRMAILIDAFLLAVSIAAVTFAFAAAGFAALRHAHSHAYQVIMRTTAVAGGLICLITWLAYIYQLYKCMPTRAMLYSLLPSMAFSVPSIDLPIRKFERKNPILGHSSRSEYPIMRRQQIKEYMKKDLVPCLSTRSNLITRSKRASRLCDQERMKQILRDCEIEHMEKLLSDISVHRKRKQGDK